MHVTRIIALGFFTLALAACSSSDSTSTLSCSATGTTAVGAATSTSVTNPTVSILGGNGGPYTITFPGAAVVTATSNFYTYSGTTTTGLVSVTDTSNNTSASCSLNGGSTFGTSGTLTASTTNPAVGQAVTITGTSTLTYTFSLLTPIAGVVLTPTSAYSATLTSTIATSVTVNGVDSSGQTSTITIVFGGTGTGTGTGTTYGTITVSTSYGTVGSPITLTGNSAYTYTFQLISGPGYVTQTSPYSATVTATANGTIQILATSPTVGQTTITLTFGTGTPYPGGGYGSVTCQLQAAGYLQTNSNITFFLTASNGEQAYLTSFNPGEPYTNGAPTFPRTSLTLRYDVGGTKSVSFTGQTNSGLTCAGSGQLTIQQLYYAY